MTRNEHLQWCKDRAVEYVNMGDCDQAKASFMSDMRKHPETQNHPALQLGAMLMFGGQMDTLLETKKWILGFN